MSEAAPRPALPWRVLGPSTACFAVSFAAWVALGPAARVIAADLGLSPSASALVRSLPILAGSVLRIPVGVLTDRLGARLVFPAVMMIGALGAMIATRAQDVLVLALGAIVLGVVGTTFTVGVQAVGAETPRDSQGLALGIFGAGNAGTALATAGVPLLLGTLHWREVLTIVAAVLAAGALLHVLVGRGRPSASVSLRALVAPLASWRAWRLALYYAASFGVFVSVTLLAIDVYVDGYGTSLETAGLLATSFTLTTSLVRIVGGLLSDRLGARVVLRVGLGTAALGLACASLGPPLPAAVALVFVAGLGMGFAMSATLRFVPAYFPTTVGAVTGVVGALGGVGGFVLPNVGAWCASALESPSAALLPLAALAFLAVAISVIAVRAEGSPPDLSAPAG